MGGFGLRGEWITLVCFIGYSSRHEAMAFIFDVASKSS